MIVNIFLKADHTFEIHFLCIYKRINNKKNKNFFFVRNGRGNSVNTGTGIISDFHEYNNNT